jgi:hypothetical protein
MASDFEEGMLVGLLIGEGHFGGDGRQPQVTLRMHVRHEAMFTWIDDHFPGGKLYGPYNHGGRHYYQWMARGDYLRSSLIPLLERRMSPSLDGYAYQRYQTMRNRYAGRLGLVDGPMPPPEKVRLKSADRPVAPPAPSAEPTHRLVDQPRAERSARRTGPRGQDQ